ncbi:hypothetical protein [Metabacillus fastidiosus]|uniref:hypothetical protein n=1 Tax=Metabacillus fastidiosus TaxID=1458 RepID=UPI002E202FB0|nr:hypothetical protein [Metabacillus fastidiosus]
MSGKNRKLFKYDEDDILEILTEYLAEANGFDTFQSTAILLGEPGKDLRLITIISDLEDDDIISLNLEKIDVEMDFNGSHSDLYKCITKEADKK